MNKDLMVELNPLFQNKIFTILLKKYSRHELSKLMDKSSSMLYLYKNNRVKTIPLFIANKSIKLLEIDKKELEKNIVSIFSYKEHCKNILNSGREKRKNQIKEWKNQIPKIEELINKDYINSEKWFFSYINLINFGVRQFLGISKSQNKLILKYTCYSNSKKKKFTKIFPRKIKVNKDFLYFFGLWCGDRLGSGRFGVANKEKKLNFITAKYLKKLYQKPEFILIYNNGIKKPRLDYKIDKVILNNAETKIRGYCISVGIKNSILFTFFDHLYENLDKTLSLLPNINIFFAGLFDAEGNVFLEDKCFRWSCQNKIKTEIYKKYLSKLKLFHRYDGANLVTYNKENFEKLIFPHLKHPSKINKTNLLCYKKGHLDKRFLNILDLVYGNPGSTNKQLAKLLKRVKIYSSLKFLENLNYLYKEDYPNKNYITEKGVKELSRREGHNDYTRPLFSVAVSQ